MKKLSCLFILCGLALGALAQDDSTFSDIEFEVINSSKANAEERRIDAFVRLSFSMFTLNSAPSELDVTFWDDDPVYTDSIFSNRNTNNLWSYGLNLGLGFLLNENIVLNIDNHIGWGAGGRLFNYNLHLGLGKEFRFNRFFIQPIVALGFNSTSFSFGEHPPLVKNYFEINNEFIFDNLSVNLRGIALSISPSVFIEYQVTRELSIFGKASVNYPFIDWHYFTVSGETDEIDEEGDYITARERIGFDDPQLQFNVNNQRILDNDSPFLHYNFNGVQFQFGVSLGLGYDDIDEAVEVF